MCVAPIDAPNSVMRCNYPNIVQTGATHKFPLIFTVSGADYSTSPAEPNVKLCRFLFIPLSLGLFACASNEPKPPKTTESFTTLIQTNSTKQFSYTLVMEMPERNGKPPRGGKGMGRGMRGGHPDGTPPSGKHGKGSHHDKGGDNEMLDKVKHLTEEGLLATLEDTDYCRNGYRQLSTQSRRGAMNILGECYDIATDEDREKFPNPAPKKVVEERLD